MEMLVSFHISAWCLLPSKIVQLSVLCKHCFYSGGLFIAEGSGTDVIIRSETKWSQLKDAYNGN